MSTNDKKRNVYVIDANVFIGADISPFRSFRDAIIVVPMHVLDALEKRIDDRDQGWACKAVINYIERLRASEKDGDKLTTTGVMDKNGNIVIVATTPRAAIGITHSQMTIEITKEQQNKRPGQQVTLISNTLSTRVRADEADLHAEPFAGSFKQFDGRIDNVDVELDPSSDIVHSKSAMSEALKGVDKRCQALDMPTPSHAAITFNDCGATVYLKHGEHLIEYRPDISAGSIRPREGNVDQTIALQYLMDPNITAVSLGGVAGGGKSLLALASAIAQTSGRDSSQHHYERIMVFRSMIEVAGQEVGFLPGELSNKMQPWAQAIWDNVDQIDRANGLAKKKSQIVSDEYYDIGQIDQEYGPAKKKKDRKRKPTITQGNVDNSNAVDTPQLRHPEISIEPVSYLRGRTFNDTFIIVDDAQSLERSTILSIITRLGRGSKIVFTYDMSQQDNRFISRGTSILSVISDLMQRPEFAHVSFTKSERSALAQFAADLLTADAA